MPTIVDSLVLAFGLDSRQLDKGIQQTSANIKREADKLDAALGTKARGMANNFLMPFKQMIAPIMGALSLGAAVGQYANAADAVGKLSDAIGVNMEDLQAWSEAAARAGGSVQGFQNTIQMFNQRLQATVLAGGKDETSKALQSMGVAAVDASGKARDAFDVLRDMASSAEGLSKAEFKGLAEKLGIDRGTIMLLQSGRKSLDELIQRQKELGVYTKEDAEIAAKFNDATADMMQVIKAASAGVMRVLVPAITWLTEKLTIVVGFFRDNSQFVVSTLGVIAGILAAKLVPAMLDLAKAGARAMAPFAPFIALVVGLGLVIDDLWAYIEGGDSVLSELWSEFGTGEEISKALSDAWQFLKGAAVSLLFIMKPVLKGIADAFKGLSKFLAGFIEWIRAIFNGDMQAAADAGAKVWDGFKQTISAVWTALQTVVKNALQAIIGYVLGDDAAKKFGEKWDAIQSKIESIWQAVENVFLSALSLITGLISGNAGSELFVAAWDGIVTLISTIWETLKGIVKNALKAIVGFILGDDAAEKFGQKWDATIAVIERVWNAIRNAFKIAIAFITGLFKGDIGSESFKATWKAVSTFFDTLWSNIKGIFSGAVAFIVAIFTGDLGTEAFKAPWNAISTFFSKLWDDVKAIFSGAVRVITGLFSTDTGASLFTASWDGVTKFFDDLWKSVTGIFEDGYKAVMKIWDMLVGTLMKGVAFVKDIWKGLTGGVKETTEFYTVNADTDWEELAERAANGEDVSELYKPRPADSISQNGLNAADGKTEQNVTNTTDIRIGDVTIETQATDAEGISQAFVDNTTSKWGAFSKAAQTGTLTK